jgi:hypothetical protein
MKLTPWFSQIESKVCQERERGETEYIAGMPRRVNRYSE